MVRRPHASSIVLQHALQLNGTSTSHLFYSSKLPERTSFHVRADLPLSHIFCWSFSPKQTFFFVCLFLEFDIIDVFLFNELPNSSLFGGTTHSNSPCWLMTCKKDKSIASLLFRWQLYGISNLIWLYQIVECIERISPKHPKFCSSKDQIVHKLILKPKTMKYAACLVSAVQWVVIEFEYNFLHMWSLAYTWQRK